jgi:hypothetical protein
MPRKEVMKTGYTHYWYRQKTIDRKTYRAIVNDFKKIVPVLEHEGVKLAGGDGEGDPELDDNNIQFNGVRDCGHPVNAEICIAWAAPDAHGVGSSPGDVDGQWFAGRYLTKRCCDGDCSHETFSFPRVLEPDDWQQPKSGKWFDFCKTAFKPYDWAVTAFLLIAKHYLADRLLVLSDGTSANWQDARLLCQVELGYGLSFQLDE